MENFPTAIAEPISRKLLAASPQEPPYIAKSRLGNSDRTFPYYSAVNVIATWVGGREVFSVVKDPIYK